MEYNFQIGTLQDKISVIHPFVIKTKISLRIRWAQMILIVYISFVNVSKLDLMVLCLLFYSSASPQIEINNSSYGQV